MKEKKIVTNNVFDGELKEELMEFEKMCKASSYIEAKGSTTSGCGGLLTLICC